MTMKEIQHEEAIRRLLRRTRPEKPSDDFASRLMERIEIKPVPSGSWFIRYQWFLFLVSLSIVVFLLFFPVWSWFGIEFTPGRFILFYAAEAFRLLSVWVGEMLSRLGTMGKMMYLLPVSVAILLLASLDQALRKPAHNTSRA